MIPERKYVEEELLPLSGLHHCIYCRRRWALVHVEQQWEDNVLTTLGNILHERAHDASFVEKREGLLVTRAMPLVSLQLGLSGQADVVEFHQVAEAANAVKLPRRKQWWQPRPVEYKKGKPMTTNVDRVQLCAQAMCLEEMLDLSVSEGDIFYWEVRARERVPFSDSLRDEVVAIAQDMHGMAGDKKTPPAEYSSKCRRCSLIDICMPKLSSARSVEVYLQQAVR